MQPIKNTCPAPGRWWITRCSTHPTKAKAVRPRPVVLIRGWKINRSIKRTN